MIKKAIWGLTFLLVCCFSFVAFSLSLTNVKTEAEDATQVIPTLTATKVMISTDGNYMLLVTAIKDCDDVYEVGYAFDAEVSATLNESAHYYTGIQFTSGGSPVVKGTDDIFGSGYTGMIIWEVEYDSTASYTYNAYARVGEREDGVFYESETIVENADRTTTGYSIVWKIDGVTVQRDENVAVGDDCDYEGMEILYAGGDYKLITEWATSTATNGNKTRTATTTTLDVQDKTATTLYLDANDATALSSQIQRAVKLEDDELSFDEVVELDDGEPALIDGSAFISSHNTGNDATARTATIAVYNDATLYKFNSLVATKVINNYSELASLQSYTTVSTGLNADNKTYYSYGGYFVLGNNIIAAGSEEPFSAPSVGSIGSGTYADKTYGFHGTFDGRGYTVEDFDYYIGGVFGDIGNTAVIKNVAFTGCKATKVNYSSGDTRQDGIGVLSANARGSFTIENVFVEFDTKSPYSGALLGRSVQGGTIRNSVIIHKQSGGWSTGAIAGWGVEGADGNTGTTLTNVYMILQSSATRVFGNTDSINIRAGSTYSLVENSDDPTAITYSALSDTIWNSDVGTIPSFKTVANYVYMGAKRLDNGNIIYGNKGTVSWYLKTAYGLTGADNIKCNGSNIDNNFLSDHDTTNNATGRTATLTFTGSDGKDYTAKVFVATKVIETYEELASLYDYGISKSTGLNSDNKTYYSYGGYFVLSNNITATGSEEPFSAPSIGAISSGGQMVETYGFHGTFDGRGYTVSGFDYYIGGIFGDIGNTAVIKDVAFTGCKATKANYSGGDTRQDGIGVLSANAKGTYVIDNVFVEFDTKSPNGGALLGRSVNGGTIKNTVIVHKQSGGWNTGAIAGWGVWTNGLLLDNVYMILQGGATRIFGNTDSFTLKTGSTYTLVANNEDPTAKTYSGLKKSIWNVQPGSIPSFKTAS